VRELERIGVAVRLPPVGSFVRLLYLGVIEGSARWLYLVDGCFVYGLVIQASVYDVFLIRTVIRRTQTLWNPPFKVALYQLVEIHEQGDEGDESADWHGYGSGRTFHGSVLRGDRSRYHGLCGYDLAGRTG
jgi:hypothetical protein